MAGPRLSTNIATSTANVVAVVGTSLVAVPLLVDRLGLAGYGLWALGQSLVIYISTAELGFGPALARFTSIHAADRETVRRILVGSLALYAAIGLAFVVVFRLVAAPGVALFDVPARFVPDAEAMVRILGWVVLAALVAAVPGHVLSGLERFTAFTVTNVAGSLTFLAVLIFLLRGNASLQDVAHAAVLQWTVVAVLRFCVLRDVFAVPGGWRPERALFRELIGFSARLQPATLATLVNTQTDRAVVGLVAPATTLGQVSIGTQVAEAARFLAYAVTSPLASRMAVSFGSGGRPALDALLERYRPVWIVSLIGAVAIGVGATRPAIAAWIGPGHDDAALFAVVLLAGYGVGLIPSVDFAYLRASGRPGLEGAFGLLTVAANLVATIVLGVLFGAIGVVVATACAYLVSTLWVTRRIRRLRLARPAAGLSLARATLTALAGGALTYLAGEALLEALPRVLALAAIGALAGLALVAHLAAALGMGPAALRRLARGAAPA